jgi:hypothetical protein
MADSEGSIITKAFVPGRTLPKPAVNSAQTTLSKLENDISALEEENHAIKVQLERFQSQMSNVDVQKPADNFSFGFGVLGFGVAGVALYSIFDKLARKSGHASASDSNGAELGDISRARVPMMLDVQSMAGITKPVNFWDPANLSSQKERAPFDPLGYFTPVSEGKLLYYREAELKHGRVAMLGTLGFFLQEKIHPFFDITGPAVSQWQQVPIENFWSRVIAVIGVAEFAYAFNYYQQPNEGGEGWALKTDRTPGDFGFDPLSLKPSDPERLKNLQNGELNNGRLAMFAILGFIAQEKMTGQPIFS